MNAFTVVLLAVCFAVCAAQLNVVHSYPNLDISSPVDFQNDGSSDYLYVVQQAGVITIFYSNDGQTSGSTFIDLTSLTTCCGERGLLGLAFHPNYATNRYFFTYRTSTINSQLTSVVSRFTAASDGLTANIGSELILLTFDQPYANHNGGCIHFGPDGFLYIGAGDGGSGGDPNNNGQGTDTLLGKILRIDVNNPSGGKNYGIPPLNPFANGVGGRPEIFAYGMRNPWRFSFDSETGDLWAGDVGQDSWEEIDVITVGGNYGWRVVEGTACYNPSSGCDKTGKIDPILVYSHSVGQSITGGYVYRGSLAPEISGKYIFGDYGSLMVWAVTFDPANKYSNSIEEIPAVSSYRPSAFGVDRCNELYMLSYNENRIYKFVGSGTVSCPNPSSASSLSFYTTMIAAIALLAFF